MNGTANERTEKTIETQHLLQSMVMELRFYGMADNHRLLRQTKKPLHGFDRMERS